jgi:ADP-ribose pyrophosphatase YjhB (NUDIX family)
MKELRHIRRARPCLRATLRRKLIVRLFCAAVLREAREQAKVNVPLPEPGESLKEFAYRQLREWTRQELGLV